MKTKLKIFLSVLLTCLIFTGVGFNALSINTVEASSTSAKGMCVLEQQSKRVLYQKDMDTMRANASTTKIVTAITVIQNCDNLDEVITVNNKSIGIEGTSIYLRKDEQLSVRDLLYGLMLRSGNDSAVALAYHVGGTKDNFVNMMNQLCVNVGAKNTHFANPHGLDEENQCRTLHEIGCMYNVTRERINYIIHRALRKLRHPSRRNILKEGLTVYNMECEANRKLLSEKKQLIEETYERRKQDLLTMLDTPFDALMCLSMDMLDLSIRPRNCLRRHFQCDTNTVTIKDVLKLIEQDELQNVRNLGRRSYDKIIERMDKMLQTNCGTSLSIYLIDHRKKEEE